MLLGVTRDCLIYLIQRTGAVVEVEVVLRDKIETNVGTTKVEEIYVLWVKESDYVMVLPLEKSLKIKAYWH